MFLTKKRRTREIAKVGAKVMDACLVERQSFSVINSAEWFQSPAGQFFTMTGRKIFSATLAAKLANFLAYLSVIQRATSC